MPAVMVLAKPKGEPIAATQSPGSRRCELPRRGVELALRIGEAHRDVDRIGDEMRVGEDVAVLADDEARADAFAGSRRACARGGVGLPPEHRQDVDYRRSLVLHQRLEVGKRGGSLRLAREGRDE